MTLSPSRAARRVVPILTVSALLSGSLAVWARPALALGQDARPADAKKSITVDAKTVDAKSDSTKDSKAYTIKRAFKAGDVDRYQIDMDIAGAQSVTIALLLKNTTKDVKADGGATVTGEFEKANATLAGTDQEITGLMPTLTQTLSPAGKLTDLKTEGGSPLLAQTGLSNIIKSVLDVAVYPPNAVKPGDTWEYHSDAAQADQKVKGTATFVGPETIGGVATVKIKTVTDGQATAPNPATGEKVNIKTHAEGTQNLDAATGRIVKVQTSVASKVDGGVGDFTVKFTMALVTGDAKGDKATPATDGKTPGDKKDAAKTGAGR